MNRNKLRKVVPNYSACFFVTGNYFFVTGNYFFVTGNYFFVAGNYFSDVNTCVVFTFHQQNSVIKIVREKYLNTTAFVDKEKLQAFLSELYVFLIDQMHAALNKVIFLC